MRTSSGSGEQQVCDVHAGDEQHETNGAEEHEQRGLYVAKHFLSQRNQPGADVVVAIGKSRGEIARDAVHVGDGLIEGNAGFEAANAVNAEPCTAAIEQRIAPLADGHKYFGEVCAAEEEIEGSGNDA